MCQVVVWVWCGGVSGWVGSWVCFASCYRGLVWGGKVLLGYVGRFFFGFCVFVFFFFFSVVDVIGDVMNDVICEVISVSYS